MRKIIKRKRYSQHVDDSHLFIILAEFNGQYVTWVYNDIDDCCVSGHYFKASQYAEALRDYNER
jgi:hypothetical protein